MPHYNYWEVLLLLLLLQSLPIPEMLLSIVLCNNKREGERERDRLQAGESCLIPAKVALPREHHNLLPTHFLFTLTLNQITCADSTTPQFCCHHLNTSQHLCYFGNDNKKGGYASVKNVDFLTFLPLAIFGCCLMTMDSLMLSHRDGDPLDYTSLSVVLPLSDDASGSLADIVKVGEGSGTFDKYPERFSSVTINSRLLDSH